MRFAISSEVVDFFLFAVFAFSGGVLIYALCRKILGRLPYFKKKWAPPIWEIVVGEDDFQFVKNGQSIEKVAFGDIARLEVYKRDQLTVDLICCDIMLGTNENDRMWTVHEDIPGFDELMKRFAELPGFNTEWFAAIVKPAFEENRTVIFDRASGKDFRPVWKVEGIDP